MIPEELSVVGFDNIRITEYMTPPLTTIEMSERELVQIAFPALLQDVQREKPNPKGTEYVLKTGLVLRETTALNPRWSKRRERTEASMKQRIGDASEATIMRKRVGRFVAATIVVAGMALGAKAQMNPAAKDTFRADQMETVLYGAAYYPEYMPYERLGQGHRPDEEGGYQCGARGRVELGIVGAGRRTFEYAWMDQRRRRTAEGRN